MEWAEKEADFGRNMTNKILALAIAFEFLVFNAVFVSLLSGYLVLQLLLGCWTTSVMAFCVYVMLKEMN